MTIKRKPSTSRFNRRSALGSAFGGLLVPARMHAAASRQQVQFRQESESGYPQAISSTHSQATQAGADILRSGGSAADAAVAIAAMLSIVEPYFSSALGGGAWALYYNAESGEVTALDGVGPIGSKFTLEDYTARVGQWGIHQANVPGAWDGWMLWLQAYGRLTLPEILAPAIRMAEEGIVVSAEMANYMSRSYDVMAAHGPTASVYAPNGTFPGQGQTMYFPAMAETFRALSDAYAAAGDHPTGIQAARDYFYRGPLAEAIIAESDAGNGYLTIDDFAGFKAEIVEPISISYGSRNRVYQNPPNSQGISMLLALNTLKHFSHDGLSAMHVDTIHTQVEAMKLAFADRNAFIGDPDFVDIDVDYLLSDEHAAAQADRISMNSVMFWPDTAPLTQMEPQNTTTFHVSDQWGNAAAVTTSIGLNFLIAGSTGIHMNHRMLYTSLDPDDPNVAAPGRKLRHTSCPYIVLRDDEPFIVGGNTGADSQPQVQLQHVMAAIDFGMSAQEAMNNPRWIVRSFVPSVYPHNVANDLQMEASFPQEVVSGLQNRGHIVEIGGINLGNGGMIKFAEERESATVGYEIRFSTASAMILD